MSLSIWPALLREAGTADWRVAAGLASIAGSLYLALTAIVHWRGATTGRTPAALHSVGDLAVAIAAAGVLLRGPAARTLLAGMGGMVPALATVAVISVLVILLPWLLRARMLGAENTPPLKSRFSATLNMLRMLAAAIAVGGLINLELRDLPRPPARSVGNASHAASVGKVVSRAATSHSRPRTERSIRRACAARL